MPPTYYFLFPIYLMDKAYDAREPIVFLIFRYLCLVKIYNNKTKQIG